MGTVDTVVSPNFSELKLIFFSRCMLPSYPVAVSKDIFERGDLNEPKGITSQELGTQVTIVFLIQSVIWKKHLQEPGC